MGYAEQMYDAFAETYQEEGDVTGVTETEIPENMVEAESFEEVNTDEAYVEGRWKGSDHQAAVTTGSSGLGFSTAAINIIKQGAVYPDQNANWSKGKLHPWWHGRWQTHSTTSWKDTNNRNEQDSLKKQNKYILQDVNYCAVLEMVTEIALAGGEIKSYMTYDQFCGMDFRTHREIVVDIKKLNYNNILSSNTKVNRKYFLFGCAIHSITDAFAHSTTDSNGFKIEHTGDSKSADEINYFKGRYKMAVYTAENVLKELKGGYIADGEDVYRAIKRKCDEGSADFKIIKIKPYISANGYEYSNAFFNQLNISDPKYK